MDAAILCRANGLLSVVYPVMMESGVSGIGIFNTGIHETRALMEEDPAVMAGVFTYELLPYRSFPGDCLP